MKLSAAAVLRAVQRGVPGLRQARTYQRRWLRSDLLSALTVGAMLIPQGLAYAQIVGVRPAAGLYAGIVGMLAYALFGPSRHLMIGPEAGAAILTAAALAPVAAGADPARYASLAALLALMVGILSLIGGLLKGGALADFLSKPILVGYINGAALIIMGSQLARLFGFERKADSFAGQVYEVGTSLHRAHVPTLLLGLGIIGALVALRTFLRKAPGPLILVVLTTVAGELFQWGHGGVKVVGTLTAEPPAFALPSVRFEDVRALASSSTASTRLSSSPTHAICARRPAPWWRTRRSPCGGSCWMRPPCSISTSPRLRAWRSSGGSSRRRESRWPPRRPVVRCAGCCGARAWRRG